MSNKFDKDFQTFVLELFVPRSPTLFANLSNCVRRIYYRIFSIDIFVHGGGYITFRAIALLRVHNKRSSEE